MTARRWTLVVYFAAEVAIIVLTMRFGRGESLQPAEFSADSAVLQAWWVMPAALVGLQKHTVWVVATAAAMLGASAASLFSMYTSTSSTAAIGFLAFPVLRIGGALGALVVAAVCGRLAKARTSTHSAGNGAGGERG